MKHFADCDRCGSAGSIQFGMCQVCLQDYSEDKGRQSDGPRRSALAIEIDRLSTGGVGVRPPAFLRTAHLT